MRRFIFLTGLVGLTICVQAQSKVGFVNDSTRPFVLGSTLPEDAAYAGQPIPTNDLPSGCTLVASLYAGTTSGNLGLQTAISLAGTGLTAPGRMATKGVILTNVPAGLTGYFRVMITDSSAALPANIDGATADAAAFGGLYYGTSGLFTKTTVSSISYPVLWAQDSTWVAQPLQVNTVSTAPAFYLHPVSQSVVVHTNVVLSAGAHSPTPFGYQWRKDGSPIFGATSASLAFANVDLSDAGRYDVVATNSMGSAVSSIAVLQVLPTNAPSILVNNVLAVGTMSVAVPASVTIAGGFPAGFIFYTLDGSTPTTAATLYNGAFPVSSNLTLRAMSLSSDFTQTSEAPAVQLQGLPVYMLTTSVIGNGVVYLSPVSGPYASNAVVTLTASASPQWAFDHWAGDLVGSSNPASITMNGPRSVQAVFVPTAYPLSISTPGGGSVTANTQIIAPNTYYPVGSVVELQATPNSGWTFMNWQGTATSTLNPLSLTMDQTQNVQAVFGTVVGTNIGGGGSISMSASNPVAYGTPLTVTALPAGGYYFVTWSGAASGTANPTTVTVSNATPVVGALFAVLPGPTVTMHPTNTTALSGKSATFRVQAIGTAPLSYQWRKGGANIPGANTANYLIPSVVAADAGSYDVAVTNGLGNSVVSSSAALTVKAWSPVVFESATYLPDGRVQLSIAGESNEMLWVDYASSWPPLWQELTNLLNSTGTVTLTDSIWTNTDRRLYRARQ